MELKLNSINHSRILYDPPCKVLEIKAKINKWDLIKLESFCKMKRQPSEWEKIIANEVTDKQLISKIYKQLLLVYFSPSPKKTYRWLTNT